MGTWAPKNVAPGPDPSRVSDPETPKGFVSFVLFLPWKLREAGSSGGLTAVIVIVRMAGGSLLQPLGTFCSLDLPE